LCFPDLVVVVVDVVVVDVVAVDDDDDDDWAPLQRTLPPFHPWYP
jgi:hypothetical protein